MKEGRMFSDVHAAKTVVPAWLSPLIAYAFVIFGQIIGGLLLGIVVGIILIPVVISSSNGQGVVFDPGSLQRQFADVFMFVELFSFAFIASLVFLWVRVVEKRSLITLGFYREKWWKELLKGLAIGLCLFSLTLFLLLLVGGYKLGSVTFSPYSFGFALLILPFWLLQGGTEELVTRGWLLPVMTAKSNRVIAVLVSSSLFGLLHLFNHGFSFLPLLNLILFGILMSYYLLKTDNLWGVAGIHAAWNFAQGNLFGILVSGQVTGTSLTQFVPNSSQEWLTGGEFGVEGSLVTSMVLLLGILFLAYQLKREGKATGLMEKR